MSSSRTSCVGKTNLAKVGPQRRREVRPQVVHPDLLPTDVTGMSVWNRGQERFEFRLWPVFSHVMLADEINRLTEDPIGPARGHGRAAGHLDLETHRLGPPFMVIATQNSDRTRGHVRVRLGRPSSIAFLM
ncbi:MAG: AAA family ATPase [Acidimicrobiales bacterium]